eukprot:CAMPEP_0195283788 /NCGR_PEP_ID=MMETSP0707-20130614/2218_1 /TAXON_ID=33640 /ORGANISM="Asterionellopsis glacialis, Strain CCMP134" /LENGTH=358 /DNA_ID=CAMNT_0040343023 /DNA_START=89 /DNA_END=1165 /DNA_ORIENTATION=+
MKIFGKRKKKSAEESSAPVNQISEAERVLQELLKKDPKDLNAKQRRIVRRHQERSGGDEQVKESSTEKSSTTDGPVVENKDVSKVEDPSSKVEKMEEETPAPEEKGDDTSDDASSSDSDSDSSSDSDNEEEGEEEKVEGEEKNNDDAKSPDDENSTNKDVKVQDAPEAEEKEKEETTSPNMGKEEVLKMLESLNSKQRRKLARQLEREGDEALDAVRDEALRLTKEAEEASKPAKVDTAIAADDKNNQHTKATTSAKETKTTKKGKKRKADWSDLPAEERFRREEQRKKQKEAAERREQEANDPNASSKKFKHPLNSERRRANRRKPKWARKSQLNMEKNEHHTSGFHMRKITKAGPN